MLDAPQEGQGGEPAVQSWLLTLRTSTRVHAIVGIAVDDAISNIRFQQ